MTEREKLMWRNATIDAYVDPPAGEAWSVCPDCLRRPRIWVFDNGRFAKCQCGWHLGPYLAAEVEAEDVVTFYLRNNTFAGYDCDLLRKLWNLHIEHLQGHTP